MKNLVEYINEAVEFEKLRNGYSLVTLVSREDVDCANISKEDFIKFIKEDLDAAIAEYKKICEPLNKEAFDRFVENEKKQAIRYAETKWKTEKKRQEYVDTVIKNCDTRKNIIGDNPEKIFFDFKPERKSTQGINQDCILDKKTDESQLERCYEEIYDNKYFVKATGWKFVYETKNEDKPGFYAYRPYVDVILDESTSAERKREEDNLTKAINDFYSHSNYWGD